MKKTLFPALLVLAAVRLQAQLPFNTMDSIDINNINATVLVHGDMWWDPATELPKCFFPNGTQKNIGFASAICMAGYDGSGQLHVAAQTYRQTGNDYWPGPLDASDTLTYATSQNWAKIWKVNRSDIQYFQSLATHTIANTPQAILTWPATGNAYAAGNGGVALTIPPGTSYAPFADLNGDGLYEPLEGDYPDVPGDQALWWMFSDNGPTHTQSNGKPLGVEVHAMAYAYSRGTLIDNVVYYQYDIVNKSPNTYNNFRLAQWAEAELGYYYDDFIGFDSVHRMGINYNGTDCDGCGAGNPYNAYGTHIPVTGLTMVSLPGDSGASYVPAGSFIDFNNDTSIVGWPHTDSQYNNYMRAEILSGVHFTYSYPGPCMPSGGFGIGSPINYVFPADPASDTSWSECYSCNNPGSRRFVLSSSDFTLLPGSTNRVVVAKVTTNLDSPGGGCAYTSFDSINIVCDTAWAVYHNPPPLPASVASLSANNTIDVYPNPVDDKLYLRSGSHFGQVTIVIYNTLGQEMNAGMQYDSNGCAIDVSQFPPGMYYIEYRDVNGRKNAKFIKV